MTEYVWPVPQSVSIILTGVGATLLMRGAYPQWSFFTGGAALFIGTIVLEGISMSLTSKVIPAADATNDNIKRCIKSPKP